MTENLVQHRSQESVWERRDAWDIERWLTAVAAGACLVAGLRHRSGAGLCLAVAGGVLAWWAAADDSERRARRAVIARRRRPRGDAMVDEASEDSFPASDAPATSGRTDPVE